MKKIIFLFFLFTILSFAHKINLFTYKEGNKIFVEGYFSDGVPVKNSLIEIYNEKGEKIINGKTNEEGLYSFEIPECKKIKIVLTGDMGHKVEKEMEIEEKKTLRKEETKTTKKEVEKKMDLIDKEEIKKIVEESVEKAIVPLIKEIEKEKEKARIMDIIGGIGYIFGIFGIYLYFSKK
jgi:nickel transport protein